jgi:hypothetical protein
MNDKFGKDFGGSDLGEIETLSQNMPRATGQKPRETSPRIIRAPTDIRTQHLLNKKLKCYH